MAKKLSLKTLLLRQQTAEDAVKIGTRWTHVKTGNRYHVTDVSFCVDREVELVTYVPVAAGLQPRFTRTVSEFLDGRFSQ
jgi:hypothetical protein